jgi:hypothetical protein
MLSAEAGNLEQAESTSGGTPPVGFEALGTRGNRFAPET